MKSLHVTSVLVPGSSAQVWTWSVSLGKSGPDAQIKSPRNLVCHNVLNMDILSPLNTCLYPKVRFSFSLQLEQELWHRLLCPFSALELTHNVFTFGQYQLNSTVTKTYQNGLTFDSCFTRYSDNVANIEMIDSSTMWNIYNKEKRNRLIYWVHTKNLWPIIHAIWDQACRHLLQVPSLLHWGIGFMTAVSNVTHIRLHDDWSPLALPGPCVPTMFFQTEVILVTFPCVGFLRSSYLFLSEQITVRETSVRAL